MSPEQIQKQSDLPTYPPVQPEEEDFSVDESIVRLLRILLPRMKAILAVSCLAAALVGTKIFFLSPRHYVCTAVIAPDVMPDLTSFDFVQLKTADTQEFQLPFASQIGQIKTLVDSSQVGLGIIRRNGLVQEWGCKDEQECLRKLKNAYKIREIRQIGLEIKAQTTDPVLSLNIVNTAVEETNSYLKGLLEKRVQDDLQHISQWIDDVTQAIQNLSSESIRFASENNVGDLEAQFTAGASLLASIKQDIVKAEAELAKKEQELGNKHPELLPMRESLRRLRNTLQDLLYGSDSDGLFPPLKDYEQLRLKMEDYQQQLNLLRSRADLFNKQLAAAQVQLQKQVRSVMLLDEPFVEPASKGTVKYSILTLMGVFFFASVFVLTREYWRILRQMIYS